LTTFIYALTDPRTGAVRYVGKTAVSPRERLCNHISEARNGRKTHLLRCVWIAELLLAGLKPIMSILDTVSDGGDWQASEKHWISHYRATDCDLLNVTHGGNGSSGLSPETRAKVSAARLGKKKSPLTIERMRAAQKGRTFTPEQKARIAATLRARAASDPEYAAHLRAMADYGRAVRWGSAVGQGALAL
jgi:hypothetical protein